jgi:TetR/AcrR family transcriptional regulator, regulator of mycofactocin system
MRDAGPTGPARLMTPGAEGKGARVFEADDVPEPVSARTGRSPVTTRATLSHVALTLFLARGYDGTTVDDVARAAGIGRRTLFRYFPSKTDLPWGDFDALLEAMRARLAGTPADVPTARALRDAILEFNVVPEPEWPYHRQRMHLLLDVPSLVAHSTLRYAAWRRVVAEFVADRVGESPLALRPQAVAWTCLGLSLTAYEQWLRDDAVRLDEVFEAAFDLLEDSVEMLR